MSNHQQRYKKKPVGFVDPNAGRLVRTVKLEERRRLQRNENYAKYRDVPEAEETEENSSTSVSREIRFQRWKAERDLRKKIESKQKKPAFKVGIVHHKFYSPIHEKTNARPVPCHGKGVRKEKYQPTPPKRITRATQKRLEAKIAGNVVTPGVASTSGLPSNRTKSIRRPKFPSTPKKVAHSFAPDNYSFKAPAGLSEVPLFGKFTIPKNTEADETDSDNKIDGTSEKEEEKPWPHAAHPPVDIMAPQNIRNSFVRQNARQRFSTDSLNSKTSSDTSIEAVDLRLSSEDESPEDPEESETAEPNNPAKQLDFETITEKIGELENSEDVMSLKNSTPPRSGSPAPASFSPYIVSSRGKNSARKEQQIKMGIRRSLSGSQIPTKDTVMQTLNISVEEEEQTAQYFKFILESTIDSLKEMCNKWEKIKGEPDLSEDAQYQINQAIGQTNLLIRKKFERFRGLVLDCETGKGEMLVTCKDLQGFWDVMYLEVENCKSRFLKLETLRSKNWIEEQIAVPFKKAIKKKTVGPKPKVAAKSSARSWILAARKKMTQPEDSNDDNVVSGEENKEGRKIARTPLKDGNSRRSLRESTSDIQDRRRSTSKATPRKTPASLRKIVQLSQASKTIRSPLAIIKISKMCKTPEVTLDNTISYVNSDQTPAKGILKKSESSTSSESCAPKSTRKVDFNDDVFLDEVPVENEVSEELQNSLDLGRALAKIDSYDDDEEDDYSPVECGFMKNVTIRKVEKHLDFEDESFIETENTDTGEAIVAVTPEFPALGAEIPEPAAVYVNPPPIPEIKVISVTPIQATPKNDRTSLNWSELYEISSHEELPEETSVSTRVLRNRTVTASTPNRLNRRSIKSPARDKPLQDSLTKENCDPLRERKEAINSDARGVVKETKIKGTSEEQVKPRRSTRKSIKLGADECSACTPKPVTPHSVRSKKVSVAGEISRKSVGAEIMEDLISFDSPIKRPTRNRRSSFK